LVFVAGAVQRAQTWGNPASQGTSIVERAI
jgi:hypothetical protein